MLLKGTCKRPTGSTVSRGLTICAEGTAVRVWRCDIETTCLSDPQKRTQIGYAYVDANGSFAIAIPASEPAANRKSVLLEAVINDVTAQPPVLVSYRSLAKLTLGQVVFPTTAEQAARGAVDPGGVVENLVIDPNSEGSVRVISNAGFDRVSDDDATDLAVQTRGQSLATYSGLGFTSAADLAERIALGLFTIQPRALALSPDEQFLYVASNSDHALTVSRRDTATGALEFVESYRDDVNDFQGLSGVMAVTVSPDGAFVYSTGTAANELGVFSRDMTTGQLTYLEKHRDGQNGVDGLSGVTAVATSPINGAHIYTAATGDNAVAVFSRDPMNGHLSFVEMHKDGDGGVIDGLSSANSVAVSNDGKYVYVLGGSDHKVAVFSRDSSTGKLMFKAAEPDSFASFSGPSRQMALSPDSTRLYVVASDAVNNGLAAFSRDSTTGRLTLLEVKHDNTAGVDGLGGASAVAVGADGDVYVGGTGEAKIAVFIEDPNGVTFVQTQSQPDPRAIVGTQDGNDVYVANTTGNAGSPPDTKAVHIFHRQGPTGALTFNSYQKLYLRRSPVALAKDVATTSDGSYVYAVSSFDDALAGFSTTADSGVLTLRDAQTPYTGTKSLQPTALALSTGDANVYMVSQYPPGEMDVFQRNLQSGALSFLENHIDGIGGDDGLLAAVDVAVSPNGAFVYVLSLGNNGVAGTDDCIATFHRDPLTGSLMFLNVVVNGTSNITGLNQPTSFAFSHNGYHLYVANSGGFPNAGTVVFSSDPMSGQLTFVQSSIELGFFGKAIALDPNDNHVYVGALDRIRVYSRNPMTGELASPQDTMAPGSSYFGFGVQGLVVSPDGNNVYAVTRKGGSVSDYMLVYSRNPMTGALTHLQTLQDDTNGVDGLDDGRSVVVSPDGSRVYVAAYGDNAIGVFERHVDGTLAFLASRR